MQTHFAIALAASSTGAAVVTTPAEELKVTAGAVVLVPGKEGATDGTIEDAVAQPDRSDWLVSNLLALAGAIASGSGANFSVPLVVISAGTAVAFSNVPPTGVADPLKSTSFWVD
jgi:hypothetical protein